MQLDLSYERYATKRRTDEPRKRLRRFLGSSVTCWIGSFCWEMLCNQLCCSFLSLLARVSFTWFIFVQPGDDAVPLGTHSY